MSPPADTACANGLARAVTLARSGRLDASRAVLLEILDAAPEQPDALQLMGLVERSRGDNTAAEGWLRRSLARLPDQPHVQNNLGNVLMDLGRASEALKAYRQALELKPDDRDALVNLGRAQMETGAPAAAADTLERAVRIYRDHGRAWTALAETRKALSRFRDGAAAAGRALELRPGHVPSLTILGVCQRFAGEADAAIETLERAVSKESADAALHCALAYAYCEAGRIDEAITAFERALAVKSDSREAHDGLNDLLWQHGRHDRYLASYPAALRHTPQAPYLWADWAGRLNFAGRLDEALAILEHAQKYEIQAPALDHRMGQVHCARGDYEAGLLAYRQALQKDPEDTSTRLDAARAHLAVRDFAAARDEAEAVLAQLPFHQEAIAYQALAGRYLGDPRAELLNDWERFVAEMELTPPDGSDPAAFIEGLARRLKNLHNASHHPADQTLRGGTQTMGDLLAKDIPEIAMLREMLEAALHGYIAALPEDDAHVFLKRKSTDFRFSGSWSVRLRPGGYHLNHVHSQGWISACYYLEVPDSVREADGRPGWLKLGESNLGLGGDDRPARYVQPIPGRLVLFPSYVYHGTVPFQDEAPRTTIAFDVVPA